MKTEQNYKITVQYDGARYHGWQSQKHTDVTIQGKLMEVLTRLNGASADVQGSGRTDAGVHARGQVASVRIKNGMTAGQIMDYLNRYLPEDIGVTAVEEAPARFHARLNAEKKTYLYRIWNSKVPNVFERKWICAETRPLHTEHMKEAAKALTGTHDFAAFCASKGKKRSSVRTVYDITIERLGGEIQIWVTGNGFLHHMVRILVGTLVEVGLGMREPEDMSGILESRSREKAGVTMPPQGLTLWRVEYPEEERVK